MSVVLINRVNSHNFGSDRNVILASLCSKYCIEEINVGTVHMVEVFVVFTIIVIRFVDIQHILMHNMRFCDERGVLTRTINDFSGV